MLRRELRLLGAAFAASILAPSLATAQTSDEPVLDRGTQIVSAFAGASVV
jgi:hypothetical protein